MHTPTLLLLLAAATVGVMHAALPDHWAPIAVVARTQGWTLTRTARVSVLAAGGHVLASLVLGGVIAVIGLQFQHQVERKVRDTLIDRLLEPPEAFRRLPAKELERFRDVLQQAVAGAPSRVRGRRAS